MFNKLKIKNLYFKLKPIFDRYNIEIYINEYNEIATDLNFFNIYYNHSNFYLDDKIYSKFLYLKYGDSSEYIPIKINSNNIVEYVKNWLDDYYVEHLNNISNDYLYIIPILNKEKYSKFIYDLYLNDNQILNYHHMFFKNLTDEYKEKLEYLINAKKFDLI